MQQKTLILKKDSKLGNMEFKARQEFETLNNVVYMRGIPVSPGWNEKILDWINKNPDLFIDDTRK